MKKSSGKILIVDDSKTYLAFASAALERAGYETLVADNIWVSKLISVEKPDLVLMDVTLGYSDGTSAVSAVKKRNFGSGIKIYLHSSEPAKKLSDLCLACGADGFIEKNGDAQRFINSVQKAMQSLVMAEC